MNEDVKMKLIQEAIKQAIANVFLESDCRLDLEFLNKINNLSEFESLNELKRKKLILQKGGVITNG